jgi:predicted transcriptional regulator
MHPIIRCKVKICDELLEVENVDSCTIELDKIMGRVTASDTEKMAYENIIEQASQLAIQLIAEEKVKYQRIKKEQEILIQKQQERFHMQSRGL